MIVLAVAGTAGVTRYFHRRRGIEEPNAVIWLYNIAAGLMLLLAIVFFVRTVAGFLN